MKNHLIHKLEVLECYIMVENIILMPEDFLRCLTLSLLRFKNSEKHFTCLIVLILFFLCIK